jgi:hypothetical protein
MTRPVLASLVAAALAAPLASGAAPHPCKPDVERLCQGIPQGGGRIAACLKSHEADLSPACRDHLAVARERMKAFEEACRPDAGRLCQGIKPGQGRIWACLKSHEAELAPPCASAMQAPAQP